MIFQCFPDGLHFLVSILAIFFLLEPTSTTETPSLRVNHTFLTTESKILEEMQALY